MTDTGTGDIVANLNALGIQNLGEIHANLNAPQLYKTNEAGEREYLSKEEKARTIAETRARKDELCE